MQKLTQTAQIFKFVKANKLATAQQIAQATQINSSTVAKLLWQLAQRKAVTQVKVEGMRCMYVANKNVVLRKKRTAKKATAKQATIRTTAKQAQAIISEAIAKLQALQVA
jgi:DNA-binding transcriptional regulator YhcF (GntR family)